LGIRREGNALAEIGNPLGTAALPTGSHIKETDIVPADRGQRFAVWGEGNGVEILLVPRHGMRDLSGRQVPKLDEVSDGRIPTEGGQQPPVRREGHAADVIRLGRKRAAFLSGGRVPHVDDVGLSGRGEEVARWCIGAVVNSLYRGRKVLGLELLHLACKYSVKKARPLLARGPQQLVVGRPPEPLYPFHFTHAFHFDFP